MGEPIKRFPGYLVGVPYMGPLPGGGYRGITEELDATVMRAAELLHEWSGLEIQVRFNSDRRSGGAFLVLPDSKSVGAGADLRKVIPEGKDVHWLIDLDRAAYRALPDELIPDTYIDAAHLDDPALANQGHSIDSPYSSRTHATIEEAVEFIKEHYRP